MVGKKTHEQQQRVLQGREDTSNASKDFDAEEKLQRSEALQIYREYVDAVGLGYQVTRRSSVTLPAYDGAVELNHVRSRPAS